LNPISVTRSRAGTVPRNSFTACFIFGIAAFMLPLTSTATMSSSGTSSDAKCVIVCGWSSSET
jgi:hypothetical protein